MAGFDKTDETGVYTKNGKTKAGQEAIFYYIKYYYEGKRYFDALGHSKQGMTKAKARSIRNQRQSGKKLPKALQKQKALEAKQAKLAEQEANRWTFGELWKEYCLINEGENKSLKNDKNRWKNHLAGTEIEKTKPEDITQTQIVRFKQELLKKGISPKTASSVFELLLRSYNFGINHNKCNLIGFRFVLRKSAKAKKQGLYGLFYPSEIDNKKTEMLTLAETKRLLDVLKTYRCRQTANAVLFALLTGFRRDEILKLQWKDVDFLKKEITLRDTKAGENQTFPIFLELEDFLNSHPRPIKGSPWVFVNDSQPEKSPDGKGQRTGFSLQREIKQLAGLPDDFRPFHGLRHDYASKQVIRGVEIRVLKELLRHGSLEMTMRYANLNNDTLRQKASVISSALQEAQQEKIIDIDERRAGDE